VCVTSSVLTLGTDVLTTAGLTFMITTGSSAIKQKLIISVRSQPFFFMAHFHEKLTS
jgi:hypothetical protein